MAAVARRYKPGYLGTVTIDALPVKVMGWKGKDSAADIDASATEDGGWSCTETGLRTFEPTFTMQVPAAGLPTFQVGLIYPCEFTIDGTIAYAGDFAILSRDPGVDLKGNVTLDVTARNHGEITVGA